MPGYVERHSGVLDIDAILEIEGIDINEKVTPAALNGVGTGVVCVTGEFQKWQPEPIEVTSFSELELYFGTYSKYVGTTSTVVIGGKTYLRKDGNGWLAVAKQKFKRLVINAVDDSTGVVTFTRSSPGLATIRTAEGPFNFNAIATGGTVIVEFEATDEVTLTLNYTAASVTGGTGTFVAADGIALNIKVGDNTYTKNGAVGIDTTEEYVAWFNVAGAFPGLKMVATDADTVKIDTDIKGTDANFEILASSGAAILAALGVVAGVSTGTGNVANNTAVTAAELVTLFDAGTGPTYGTAVDSEGKFVVATITTGEDGSVQCLVASTGEAPLGGDFSANTLVEGGTDDAPAAVLPAGTIVTITGGGKKFETMQDCEFAEAEVSVSGIKVRPCVASQTTTAGTIVVIEDAPTGDGFVDLTVTNPADTTAKASTEAQWAVLYGEAFDKLLSHDNFLGELNLLTHARAAATDNTAAAGLLQALCRDTAIQRTADGRGCYAIMSPPLATTKTAARASTGVGAQNSTVGLSDVASYAYPGVAYFFRPLVSSEESVDGMCDIPAATALASLMSQIRPEQNPGKQTGTQNWLRLESAVKSGGTIGPLTKADYKLFKKAGICAPRLDPSYGGIFQSGVTTINPLTFPNLVRVARSRFRHFYLDTLAVGLMRFAKDDGNQENRDIVTAIIESFNNDLILGQRIKNASVDSVSGNTGTFNARGIFAWNLQVEMFNSMDNILLNAEIGSEVTINEQ